MLDLARNILAFIGTFAVISSSVMLLLQGIVCCVTGDWSTRKHTDYRIIIAGIVVALALIPFYYLPI